MSCGQGMTHINCSFYLVAYVDGLIFFAIECFIIMIVPIPALKQALSVILCLFLRLIRAMWRCLFG